jgi:hypothetical protein
MGQLTQINARELVLWTPESLSSLLGNRPDFCLRAPHLTRLRRDGIYGASMLRGRFQGTVTCSAEQLRAIERLYLYHLNLRRLCRYSDGQGYTMIFRCVCFPGFKLLRIERFLLFEGRRAASGQISTGGFLGS